jgi:hypothetical protein
MRLLLLSLLFAIQAGFAADEVPSVSITINDAQLFEFDETGWVTLTAEQARAVSAMKGFSPARVRPVYTEPDGATSETGINLALRTSDNTLEVYRRWLMTEEEAKAKRDSFKKLNGGTPPNGKEFPSYIVDAEGRYWKYLSPDDFLDEIKRSKKRIGQVFIHTPTSLVDTDTVASRDGLRRLKAILKTFDLPGYEVTKK